MLMVWTGTVATALPPFAHQRAELFATCAGRLAALAAHERARGLDAAQDHSSMSGDFDFLLETTLPDALDEGVPATQPRGWWSSGWTEIAYLLAEEAYSLDQGRADRARAAREDRIGQCQDVIL